jgi:hypothetical protein
MNSATTETKMTTATFAVEGHGKGTLCVRGNDSSSWGNRWTRESKFTKRMAWDLAKEMMRSGLYHTVYVKPFAYARSESALFTAWFDLQKGTWINVTTGEMIVL